MRLALSKIPGAVAAEHVGEREQLLGLGVRARHVAAVGNLVQIRSAGAEAQRSPAHCLGQQIGHGGQIVGRRRGLLDAAFAHRVLAQRGVPDHATDVEALRHAAHAGEVLAVGHPIPGQPVENGVAWNVLDALHHRRKNLAVFRLARSEGDTTVAHHHTGDAVIAAAGPDRIPRELRIEVGVDVDEARSHHSVGGVDHPASGTNDVGGDVDDVIVDDRHVGRPGRRAGPVDNQPAAYEYVERTHLPANPRLQRLLTSRSRDRSGTTPSSRCPDGCSFVTLRDDATSHRIPNG